MGYAHQLGHMTRWLQLCCKGRYDKLVDIYALILLYNAVICILTEVPFPNPELFSMLEFRFVQCTFAEKGRSPGAVEGSNESAEWVVDCRIDEGAELMT